MSNEEEHIEDLKLDLFKAQESLESASSWCDLLNKPATKRVISLMLADIRRLRNIIEEGNNEQSSSSSSK